MLTREHDVIIERYKELLSQLLIRRAIEGPLPDDEEAELAQERADLWDELPEDRQEKLEAWIATAMTRTKVLSPVADEFVMQMRKHLVARAIGADETSSKDTLEDLLARMTPHEAAVLRAWRARELSIDPAETTRDRLPYVESLDVRQMPREEAA